MRRSVSLTAVVAVVALVVAGCGSSSSSDKQSSSSGGKASGSPVKIGYLASLTGFCSSFSQDYVRGAKLAVKLINAKGGADGHPLQLVVRDDQATPDVGVRQARDLVLSQGVKFLAGTCLSSVGKSVRQLVADPSHVVYVAGVVDPTIFANAKDSYVFGSLPTATTEGQNAASVVQRQTGIKKIALLGEDYSYSHQVFDAFKASMNASGAEIVSEDYVAPGAASYSSYINKILSKNPDIVYSTMITDDAVTFVKQAIPVGFFDKTKAIGIMDYGTMAGMNKVPEGMLGYSYYPSAAIYHTQLAKDLSPLGTASANSGAAGDGFNQIEMIAQGIAAAKSVDPTAVSKGLAGAKLELIQGNVTMDACSHLAALPVANGVVASPGGGQDFAHFNGITFNTLQPKAEGC